MINAKESWPPYRLAPNLPMVQVLVQAATRTTGGEPGLKVAGPSNIGCFLAALQIRATAGFGVRYQALHGTDEAIDLSTIPMVQAAYHEAILRLLTPDR